MITLTEGVGVDAHDYGAPTLSRMVGRRPAGLCKCTTRDERALGHIFEGRSLLSDDEFYQRYFPDGSVSKRVAVGIRRAAVVAVDVFAAH